MAGWTHMAKQIHFGIGVEWRAGKACLFSQFEVVDRESFVGRIARLVMYQLRSRIVGWSSGAPEVFSSEGSCASDGRSDGDKNISDFRTCRDYLVLFKVNCP